LGLHRLTSSTAGDLAVIRTSVWVLTVFLLAPLSARSQQPETPVAASAAENQSLISALVLYIPNRVFDLLDIFRVRARVGPGLAIAARATETMNVGVGSYASFFAGIPGPRQAVEFPTPLGLETFSGIELKPSGALVRRGGYEPKYGAGEVGVSLHLLLVGIDLGIDLLEVADFAGGLVLMNPQRDDLH
jgi:hypothetical protein